MDLRIDEMVRAHLLDMKPYSSARDEYTGQPGIFLDANENPFSWDENKLNRYPDPYQKELRGKLAEVKQVDTKQIFLGNGSDEAIDLLFRIFCEPGKDKVIITPPTYGMYKVSAQINNVELISVPLTSGFQLDLENMFSEMGESVKMMFLCSPNNPTGVSLNAEDVEALLKESSCLVVIDEAYIDFSPNASLVKRLKEFPNLIVLQTFSKAWGIAGLRLGMAFAQPKIIEWMDKVKPPYNVNGYTQKAALEVLHKAEQKNERVQEILSEKVRMALELEKFSFIGKIHQSDANFLLFQTIDANHLYSFLIGDHVIVRNRSTVTLCENCLRVTIGTKEENNSLNKALERYNPPQ